tara:strand:- start:728 stop:1264 length:537 start_codon:yes stop_codon:yes gene_type:complete
MTKAPAPGKSAKVAPILRPKKKRRKKTNGQRKAISEIKKYQQGKFATSTLIPKSCFARLARKTASNFKTSLRFQDDALSGLQSACEAYLVELLNNGNKIASCSGRMTLQANDLRLAHSIATGKDFEQLTDEEQKFEFSLTEKEDENDDALSDGLSAEESEDDGDFSEDDDADDDAELV